MKVSEIFYSIEGEGIRTGYPAVFIRLFGCQLRCTYCDSMYSVEGDDFVEMSIEDIIETISKYSSKRITLTGGEPLIHNDALDLIKRLVRAGYELNIETNGAVNLNDLYDPSWCFGYMRDNIIVTMDWKSISSGMSSRMLNSNLALLTNKDVLKFVVSSKEDLEQMKDIVTNNKLNCRVFVSPIFGKIEPKDIVQYLLDNNLTEVRMQLQIHKYIWPVDMRGV